MASSCSIILCSLQKQLVFITPVLLLHGRGGPGTNHHFGSKLTTILSYLHEKIALAPSLAHLYEKLQDRFIPNQGPGKEKQLGCPGSAVGGRGRLVQVTPPAV